MLDNILLIALVSIGTTTCIADAINGDRPRVGATLAQGSVTQTNSGYYEDSPTLGVSYRFVWSNVTARTELSFVRLVSDDFLNAYRANLFSLNLGPLLRLYAANNFNVFGAIYGRICYWQAWGESETSGKKDQGFLVGMIPELAAEIDLGSEAQFGFFFEFTSNKIFN